MSKRNTSPGEGTRAESAKRTRAALIEAAFHEMHQHGFQGASIDRILERVGVTRGALFHHFESKRALGYAVVDEFIRAAIQKDWVETLSRARDPILAIADLVEGKARTIPVELFNLGCPLNNLSQEMSPLDDGFRDVTKSVFELWVGAIANAIRRARDGGEVDPDVDPNEAAVAILATYEGGVSLTKNARARGPLLASAGAVRRYLESMRTVSTEVMSVRVTKARRK